MITTKNTGIASVVKCCANQLWISEIIQSLEIDVTLRAYPEIKIGSLNFGSWISVYYG